MSSNLLCISGRARVGAPEAEVVRGAETCSVRVTGRGASLEGDHVCAAMERAITQQPADRGGINVVGASDISLRLATGQPLQCFLPLMRRQLARPTEPNTALLRSVPRRQRSSGCERLSA